MLFISFRKKTKKRKLDSTKRSLIHMDQASSLVFLFSTSFRSHHVFLVTCDRIYYDFAGFREDLDELDFLFFF
jgi:hypothetical protein